MSENFFANSMNISRSKAFNFDFLPKRTIKQVKDTAVNFLKGFVKPITSFSDNKTAIFDGSLQKQLNTYNKIINLVSNNMAVNDQINFRSLDYKS